MFSGLDVRKVGRCSNTEDIEDDVLQIPVNDVVIVQIFHPR